MNLKFQSKNGLTPLNTYNLFPKDENNNKNKLTEKGKGKWS